MLESEIKSTCKKQLEKWGWLVIHLIQTNTNGIPDTMILRRGKVYFIEFKQPGKLPDELQKYRIRKLREQGFEVLLITKIQQIEFLK